MAKSTKNSETAAQKYSLPSLTDLLTAGVHFGHQKRRWHPRIAPFLFEHPGRIHIFDLLKTKEHLNKAAQFLFNLVKDGGSVIFVGTKRQAGEIVKNNALACGAFYVNRRWLGGTITNFDSIKQKLQRLKKIEAGLKEGGEYDAYTKKEKLDLSRELSKLEDEVGGLKSLAGIPRAIFVVDVKRESTAVAEAQKKGVPVVAIIDSNCSPEGVDYPIPGNDDSARSIEVVLKSLAEAVKSGTQERQKPKEPAEPKEEKPKIVKAKIAKAPAARKKAAPKKRDG